MSATGVPKSRRRVAVIGAGPGGISAAIALHRAGFEVRLFERQPEVKAIGGAVLLSLPVLSILRSYGADIHNLGAYGHTEFRDWKGRLRVRLPFNKLAEQKAGIPGWHYGMLRSAAYARMLDVLPSDIVYPGHKFVRFEETRDAVIAEFDNGVRWEADLLIGADGIRSAVARQVHGDPGLFHCGIQVWLGWCYCDGVPRDVGYISHSPTVQASFFPILHEGREAFEWWLVEPWNEGQPFNGDVKTHIMKHIKGWVEPLPALARATDFERNMFRWEIYNRPSLQQWSRGRVSFVGDAVHPVSPYAAYGMGMAIEDGYYIAKAVANVDLSDRSALAASLAKYETQRVGYTNKQATFARYMGYVFHRAPRPLQILRDAVFNHTRFLERMLVKNYLKDAEDQMIALDL